jgi:ribosomal protein L17
MPTLTELQTWVARARDAQRAIDQIIDQARREKAEAETAPPPPQGKE